MQAPRFDDTRQGCESQATIAAEARFACGPNDPPPQSCRQTKMALKV